MPSLCPFSRILPLLIYVSSLPALAVAASETTVTFKIANNYLIVVPVTINGSGPYDFILDTGSNNTMLDQKLVDGLALPLGGETTIREVKADSLSIAGASVNGRDLFLFTTAQLPSLPANVRGILGEDFLRHFEVLIDYRHQTIQLESASDPITPGSFAPDSLAPGSLATTLSGEHLPVRLSGTRQGELTFARLIVTGYIRELGENPVSLVLDSGANNLTLFGRDLGVGSTRQAFLESSTFKSPGVITRQTRTIQRISLGKNAVEGLTVIALANHPNSDADGLIPTLLFRSIFISHRGKFVILNPSVDKPKH